MEGGSTSSTNYSWPWFYNWNCVFFIGNADWIPAKLARSQVSHNPMYGDILNNTPDTFEMAGNRWMMFSNPSPEDNPYNKVLLSADPKSINSTEATHSVIWINDSQKNGRLWATELGHTLTIDLANGQEMLGKMWRINP